MRGRLLVVLCAVLAAAGLTVEADASAARPGDHPVGRMSTAAPAEVTHLHTYAVRAGVSVHWRNPAASSFEHVVVRYARGYTAPTRSTLGRPVHLAGRRAEVARLEGLTDDTVYTVAVWTVDAHGRRSAAAQRTFTSSVPRVPRGTYVGRVVDDQGHPLLNAEVVATDYSDNGPGTLRSSSGVNGRFLLHLAPGSWFVDIGGAHISGGDSDATGYVDSSKDVVIHPGGTRHAGDITLTPGGAISGRVVDTAGDPLAGVEAEAVPVETYVQKDTGSGGIAISFAIDGSGNVVTTSDGRYTIKGIPASTAMRVCLLTAAQPVTGGPSDDAGYADRCLPGGIAVAAGAARTEPDLALDSADGGEIDGTLTTPSGSGLGRWDISFAPARESDDDTFVGDAVTRPDGSYAMAGLQPGRYRVCAEAGQQPDSSRTGYTPGCHAGLVSVPVGGRRTADLELAKGAAVTGKVTGPKGVPVAGVFVRVQSGRSAEEAATNATGHYTVKGLASGDKTACFDTEEASAHRLPTGALSGCFGHRTHFAVHAGAVRNGVDMKLRAGGAIRGVVRDTTGKPVPFVDVEVDADRFKYDDDGGFAQTDAHGRYVVRGLAATKYRICFIDFDEDLDQTSSCHHGPVQIALGRTTHGVNGALPLDRSIAVTVQDTAGHPVAGVDAVALATCRECSPEPVFSSRTGVRVDASSTTNGAGTASLRSLKPGRYVVCLFAYYAATASGTAPDGYADRCSGSTFTVLVRAGRTTSVHEVLADGGAVSGTITDGAGHPVGGVLVHVTHSAADDYESDFFPGEFDFDPFGSQPPAESITRADGTFTIRAVQPGTSSLCADATDASGPDAGGYLNQCLGGEIGSTSGGAGITVTADTDRTGTDLALTPASGIAGTITARNGRPTGEADVVVFAGRSEDEIADAQPADDGTYTITQLPAGSYTVCAETFGINAECYRHVLWKNQDLSLPLSKVTLVSTTAGSVTGGIDLRLPKARG